MSSHVEQIKDRLDIAEVVGRYLKLERAGANLKAKCPFHNEKTPSFYVSPGRGGFYCFGCGAKGDIFTFVQEFEGLDFMGALKILAERAGVDISKTDPKLKSERSRLYNMLEIATRYFEKRLSENKGALAYLSSRGLKSETIASWRLGFSLLEWRSLRDFMRKWGFSDADLMKVGLTKKPDESGARDPYDTFRGRIMFPIMDSSGRVIGFSGRILPGPGVDEKTAKYLNSPETELFNKSKVLYGYDKAKSAIRSSDAAILVEGQMDLLMSHQAGFSNTVASSGTALTGGHLELLNRMSGNLLLAYDGDSAGFRASERAVEIALSMGMNVKMIALPKEKDPADVVLADPLEWQKAVEHSKHIVDFYLDALIGREMESRDRAVAIQKKILPLLKVLQSSVEQSHFVSKISDKTGIRADALWDDLKKIRIEQAIEKTTADPHGKIKTTPTRSNIEKKIFGILWWLEQTKTPPYDRVVLRQRLGVLFGEKIGEMEKAFEPEKDELVFEAEITYAGSEKITEAVDDILSALEEESLKKRLAESMEALALAEREKDAVAVKKLLLLCQELSRELSLRKKARGGG